MLRSSPVLRSGTAVFCALLVVNLHVMIGGCGFGGTLLPDGTVVIPLTADQPLTHSLKGTAFEGATAIAVNRMDSSFALIFSDDQRQLSGTYSLTDGTQAITSLRIARGGLSGDVGLDLHKRITSIETSAGRRWERPKEWTGLPNGATAVGVDAYIAANIELVEIARSLDGGLGGRVDTVSTGGNGTASPGIGVLKQGAVSQEDDTGAILGALGLILGAQAAIGMFPSVYFVLQVALGVQVIMAFSGLAPQTEAATASAGPATLSGDATLRVTNNLPGDTPIWFVTLLKDATTGAVGGNVLGDESIPPGTFREFAVRAGMRDINVIMPSGIDCYRVHEHQRVLLSSGGVTELTEHDPGAGYLYPGDCDNGE